MLTGYIEDRFGPGEHTGRVVEAGGVEWTVGDMKFEGGGSMSHYISYHATTEARWCRDDEGKRRKVRDDCEATWDFYEGDWTIESFEGQWSVGGVETERETP